MHRVCAMMFFKAIHLLYYITKGLLRCNVNLAKQDFEVMPGPLEMLLQYDVKDDETRQAESVCVCVCVWRGETHRTMHQQ